MYYFYLDKILLPIAPSKLTVKIGNENKTLTLINEGEINVLKKAGLTEIDFDATIPNVEYPFATYKNGFQSAKTFLDAIEKLKTDQKPFQFIVTRTFPNGKAIFNTNMKVSLENYTIKEEAKQGFDATVTFKLKQYRDYGTKTCKIKIETTKKAVTAEPKRETTSSPAPVKQNKTYTVVRGDCLWNIAKKFYGNGSQYTKIYNANKDKIKSPNLIYPGQVLTIPV
jgi:LysM repeat protein